MKNYGKRANEANWGLSQKETVAFSLISHHLQLWWEMLVIMNEGMLGYDQDERKNTM